MRKKICLLVPSTFLLFLLSFSQPPETDNFPIKAFAIAAPMPSMIDSFIVFMNTELAPRKINTLILRIDYNYQYRSHPELVEEQALALSDIQKLSAAAKKNNIVIIPQINLLGHQSWAGTASKLLQVYPEFDETPWVKLPQKYVWPNADSLYCKSYCPLYPGVHKIVFELVDELCNAFDAKAFHAGMDEVFYIGMDKCPRCGGKNKAELFAGEVKLIRDHLALKGRALWIWGDRLIDGYTTGIGEWEASYNNTHPAIDMIPKDVVICDWHYERPDKTPVYFAAKGFNVITSSWNRAETAIEQYKDMIRFRAQSTPEMRERFLGMMQTVWSDTKSFFDEFYHSGNDTEKKSTSEAFRKTFPVMTNPNTGISNSFAIPVHTRQKQKDFPVIAYLLCNSTDQIASIDFKSITHLHYAFMNPDSLGNFAYSECLALLSKTAHANGVKVLASIGGGLAPSYYSYLLDDEHRQIIINNLVRIANEYDLDGLDIDLEGERVDINYEDFVTELKAALVPYNKLLTAAIASVYKMQFTDKALRQFDYITLMTYDKTGPWRPEMAGQHSPYSMAVEDLDYWTGTRKLDKNKIYLGLPFYGYSFGPKGAGSMSFADIVNTFPGAENKDELRMPDGSTLYYNGTATIRKKVKLALKRAGGVMFWELSNDAKGEKSLLRVINETAYP